VIRGAPDDEIPPVLPLVIGTDIPASGAPADPQGSQPQPARPPTPAGGFTITPLTPVSPGTVTPSAPPSTPTQPGRVTPATSQP
jgi:hypothetical protein